jgi:hypothetical protein
VGTRLSRTSLIVLIVVIGLATGVLTLLGQGVLDEHWNRLANSGAIWLLVAFLVGSVAPTMAWAAVAGLGTLIGAVAGYYAAAIIVAGAAVAPSGLVIWIGTAMLGGPVYGLAGRAWHDSDRRRRAVAISLMGGIFVAEGLFTVVFIPDLATTGWVEAIFGVGLTLVLGRSWWDRVTGLALVPGVVAIGFAVFEVIGRLFIGA